jgi:ABC-type nitrate/sulfonate/bicarbonate transport system substrate-binding protein
LSLAADGPGFAVERGALDFPVSLFLITRPSVLERQREKIAAFLQAVDESCRYLHTNSNDARRQIERHFSFRADFLAPTWISVDYGLKYDPPRMKAEILRDAEIAMALGYVTAVPDVGYLFEFKPPR